MGKYIEVMGETSYMNTPYTYHINIDKIVYIESLGRYDSSCIIKLDGGNSVEIKESVFDVLRKIKGADSNGI